MKTYLFYDIETTGLNKSFDQVLQFAAIRTDLNLKELERHEITVRLNGDLIPSPYAMITHQIGIKETQQGIPENDAIQQIHQLLNTPGTISLGYNTLGFDDEFLRFSFFRNLLPPYTHQYANQCNRMDLYPITAMYYLYKNHVLSWPTIDGEITLKLEQLNRANNFAQGQSHQAIVDVEATLELAKCFFKEKEMWEYVLGYFNKQADQARLLQLDASVSSPYGLHQEGLLIDGIFGAQSHYQSSVLFLGEHRHYKNQSLWLRLDTTNLSLTTPETIQENTWVIRKKWGEPGFALPTKERFMNYFSDDRKQLALENKNWLQKNPDLFTQIIDYHAHFKFPVLPNTDTEASLYHMGFWNFEEEKFCRDFHKSSPEKKSELIETLHNHSLKNLAIRLLGRHYPDALTSEQLAQYEAYLHSIHSTAIIDFKGTKRLSPQEALLQIADCRNNLQLSSTQQNLLNELEEYLQKNFSKVDAGTIDTANA